MTENDKSNGIPDIDLSEVIVSKADMIVVDPDEGIFALVCDMSAFNMPPISIATDVDSVVDMIVKYHAQKLEEKGF